MYQYGCSILRVIDGDTVEVQIDLGFDLSFKSSVRLKGINAPELSGVTKAAGLTAKSYLSGLLPIGGQVTVHTDYHRERDKYGRVLGTFWVNGINVNQAMLDAGHAVPYMV